MSDIEAVDEVPDAEPKRRWKQDPEAVRANILAAAAEEFAEHGLTGARVSEIAARTRTSKRMIYYYFEDKETLYRRVLEEAYRKVRGEESSLDLSSLAPLDALRKLVEFTFDHHRANESFIRLVMVENVHKGRHLATSDLIARVNASAIERVHEICARGQEDGSIRASVTPLELHWMISALCFFNVSNRPSFGISFGEHLFDPENEERLRALTIEAVLSVARPPR
ncbi:AcrR family transcriptional regulator [Rhodobium orientis]|uniref:TetR family transcriptional regulator n=1 Tax=Rhodobium orientis TaxID=34017 RepID=A0A327JSM5_9HYPH|nr:TetR family transcriptional regulator [Rhodobium orientis]MBB4303976.1 AcrR family transcriptional regulator [Rhodobium orientis]MBK5950814.1 TetR family transcriptional regulator [Rhodobium orientis]RAI29520.1 TetR family transcriptional regulator [Rhodobium orientis]